MSLKRTLTVVVAILLITAFSAHSAQNANPPRLALEIQMSGQKPLYVPLDARLKPTLLTLPSGETIALNFRVQPNLGILKVNISAPIDRGRALAKGFEKDADSYASYDVALEPGAKEVWVEDLSIFGIQPIAMSVVEDPNPPPTTACTCGSETCYPKPGQCVDCGCATCCAAPSPGGGEES